MKHINNRIQLVQCKTEAKHTYSLSYFTNTAPYIVFPWVSRGQRSRAYLMSIQQWDRQAYMLEECSFCYLCFSKACFQQRLEIDFCKIKCSSGTKFSIESLVKVLSSKYALPSSWSSSWVLKACSCLNSTGFRHSHRRRSLLGMHVTFDLWKLKGRRCREQC